MPRPVKGFAAASLLALGAATAHAQQYLVTDTTNRAVMLIDGTAGTILNAQFIADSGTGNFTFSLPIEAVQVNGEIWVADQVSDQLVRFDLFGNWISTLSTGLDNVRGLTYLNGLVYLVNFGTANGAPGKRILVFDLNGNQVSSFATGDLFDVAARGNELLVSNTLLDDIERYSLGGNFLGTFHNSDGATGIDFPSQVTPLLSGEVLAAGQSAPTGFFLYDANGVQTTYFPVAAAVRGVARTDAGKYLYSTNSGVFLLDPATSLTSDVAINLAPYYISLYRPPGPPENYCTAGTSSLGCAPQLAHTGTPSASASSGFVISALPLDAQRSATFFYGVNGRQSLPWAAGSTSFFCVRAPIQRTPTQNTGGTVGNCNGFASLDWNAFAAANPNAVGQPYVFGTMVNAQCWFRDPPAAKSTNLSNALEFFVQP